MTFTYIGRILVNVCYIVLTNQQLCRQGPNLILQRSLPYSRTVNQFCLIEKCFKRVDIKHVPYNDLRNSLDSNNNTVIQTGPLVP